MIKLVVMTVAAAAALAPAAALGQNDWTGIIGSGRPGTVSNWAADAPDRLAPGAPERLSPPAPFARPLGGETNHLDESRGGRSDCVTIGCIAAQGVP